MSRRTCRALTSVASCPSKPRPASPFLRPRSRRRSHRCRSHRGHRHIQRLSRTTAGPPSERPAVTPRDRPDDWDVTHAVHVFGCTPDNVRGAVAFIVDGHWPRHLAVLLAEAVRPDHQQRIRPKRRLDSPHDRPELIVVHDIIDDDSALGETADDTVLVDGNSQHFCGRVTSRGGRFSGIGLTGGVQKECTANKGVKDRPLSHPPTINPLSLMPVAAA